MADAPGNPSSPTGHDELARLRGELDALHATARALSAQAEADALLEGIAGQAASLVEGSIGYVYVLSEDGDALVQRVGPEPFAPFVGSSIGSGVGVAGRVWASGRTEVMNDYRAAPDHRDLGDATPAAALGVPLVAGGELIGVLGLAHLEVGRAFSDVDSAVVERFAQLASLALERVRLQSSLHEELEQRRRAEEELLDTVARLTASEHALMRTHEEMVRRLASAAEQRDGATGRHIERMSETCEQIARRIGLDETTCESIRIASPLHDIGKIAIPDHVLLKPGPLGAGEREEIERHAEIGHAMLEGSGSELLDLAASIALTHHERYDGTGYPRGLRGEEIPLEGRIAAVADVFDALTSDRVYRMAFSVETTLEMMAGGRGTQFDPVVLDAFLELFGAPAALDAPAALSPADGPSLPGSAEPGGMVSPTALSHGVAQAVRCLCDEGDERQAVDVALRRLCRTAGSGAIASVYVLDHERLWCVAQCGYDQVRDGFMLGQGVMGRAVLTGEPQVVPDVRADPRYIAAVPGIVAEIAIPLVGRRTRGVLNIETIGFRLPDDVEKTLRPLVEPLTRTIDAIDAPLRLDLSTLARLTVYASSLRTVGALTEFVTRTLGRLLNLEAAQLTLGAGRGRPAAFWQRPESSLRPIAGAAVEDATRGLSLDQSSLNVLDAVELGVAKPGEPGRWLLWLPLRVGGQQVGTLLGRSAVPISLGNEQAEATTLFTQHAAAVIDVAQALRREQRAAVTDSLTGLLNRRGFDERLREEIARAERSGCPLAVILTDCDDLKQINDREGHEAGDVVLQGIARILRHGKRAGDVAGRVGGDEFGLLLPEANAETAAVMAERLRLAFHEVGAGHAATASFGIAAYPADGITSATLLRAADRALYEAKHGGKDRLAGARDPSPSPA